MLNEALPITSSASEKSICYIQKVSMKRFLFTILILFQVKCYNQSLNGLWKGGSQHSIFVLNPVEEVLELEVNNDRFISGVIHSYYTKGRFDHVKISGFINWKDSIFTIIDGEEISHNINTKIFSTCFGTMKLKLSKTGNTYRLYGKWVDNDKGFLHCPTLTTWFEKSFKDTIQTKPATDIVLLRETDIQKVIEVENTESDSIKLSIYDNGEIDGDTASLYFNDSILLRSGRLSQKPIEFFISLKKTKQINKIKLVAENLGSIPPNTALLIITIRNNRYIVTLSSDYSKNGSVELFLKE
jgi:hypothetical protein